MIVNRETRVQTRLDHQSGTRNDILVGGKKYLCFSILFHNTQLLALIVIKMWENWSSALEEVETVIVSRFKHEFLAIKGWGGWAVPPWRWSETERRGSVQRHLLLPLRIHGPMHLHTLVHETCYCNVLAVSIVNSLDALGHEAAMLRRWASILHLPNLSRGNWLELAYNRGSFI